MHITKQKDNVEEIRNFMKSKFSGFFPGNNVVDYIPETVLVDSTTDELNAMLPMHASDKFHILFKAIEDEITQQSKFVLI